MPGMSARAFVEKWERVTVNEKAAAQSHFNELCDLLEVPRPTSADPTGTWYRFEKSLSKAGGGAGFADVWREGTFVCEYKTKGKSLDLARQQILNYKGDLGNPPVTLLCDINRYELYIEFTGYRTRIERFVNKDLLNVSTRELLRAALNEPLQLCPTDKTFTITESIAANFAQVAQWVEKRGNEPRDVAHFFMKLIFAMFAEDIGLLPNNSLSETIKAGIFDSAAFNDQIRPLFRIMHTGGYWGPGNKIPQFNGSLFDDDAAIELKVHEIERLALAAHQDWKDVEPAIFGTLFERSLDPAKRTQLGAHYTSQDDILLLVEPVLMRPLRREWEATKAEIELLRPKLDTASGLQRQRLRGTVEGKVFGFSERLSTIKVLDPACGSGNFLYVALNLLKDLEKEVITYAQAIGVNEPEQAVGPHQLFGIELNPYAAELAQVVVWIGELQWNSKNGYPNRRRPVLQKLNNFVCADALLAYDMHTGEPVEAEWPTADVIVGNPPFLGDKKMRRELGDEYVTAVRKLYSGKLPGAVDLVAYWFEKARSQIEKEKARRAGLLATQGIRGGANRAVLHRIKCSGDMFFAKSDRPWILDGATVHVSMVGFDNGLETMRELDGKTVAIINTNLTCGLDLTVAKPLEENKALAFQGPVVVGPFDIPSNIAEEMLQEINPTGVNNHDVIFRMSNTADIIGRSRNWYIIDFGQRPVEEASLYTAPYNYVLQHVKPYRDQNRDRQRREYWWRHGRSGVDLRKAISEKSRQIVTPLVSKHRIFAWLPVSVVVNQTVNVIARDDDYIFGVLHSRIHELWARGMGTQLREVESGFRYTPTTTFETFPFPWPPGHEPKGDSSVETIAKAARELVGVRSEWLNPPGLFEDAALPDRTLTNLYNIRPDWLAEVHRTLDEAVLIAYGWPSGLGDNEILARLLTLNHERSGFEGTGPDREDADI